MNLGFKKYTLDFAHHQENSARKTFFVDEERVIMFGQ